MWLYKTCRTNIQFQKMTADLEDALQFTEDLREPYLKENENES
jgi:hypothetical protein